MSVTRWIERGQVLLVVTWVFGLGYAVGFPELRASCATPECKEVFWAATFANLNSPPAQQTVSLNERYDKKHAFTLYSDTALSGTPVTHNTAPNMKRTGCSPYSRKCPATLKNGTYEVSRWDKPEKEDGISNCSAKMQCKQAFCANAEGEGVNDSWHKGKKKDEAPAE